MAAPIRVDEPQPGFYRRQLAKNGPWVPVRIWRSPPRDPETGEPLDRSWTIRARVGDQDADPYDIWTWVGGNPITKEEYRYMLARGRYATAHQPGSPDANPRKPIDPESVPIPSFD